MSFPIGFSWVGPLKAGATVTLSPRTTRRLFLRFQLLSREDILAIVGAYEQGRLVLDLEMCHHSGDDGQIGVYALRRAGVPEESSFFQLVHEIRRDFVAPDVSDLGSLDYPPPPQAVSDDSDSE
jgi:hypothetical protein